MLGGWSRSASSRAHLLNRQYRTKKQPRRQETNPDGRANQDQLRTAGHFYRSEMTDPEGRCPPVPMSPGDGDLLTAGDVDLEIDISIPLIGHPQGRSLEQAELVVELLVSLEQRREPSHT